MTHAKVITILIAASLLAASCGGSDDESASTTTMTDAPETTEAPNTTAEPATTDAPTTTEATTTTEAPTTTEDSADGALPDSPVVIILDQSYDFVGGTPDPALLPAAPGTVEASVYRTATTYAVVFRGLGLDVDACPGNSALTPAGFEFVSNAPLPAGTCDSFPTLIENTAAQGIQICGGQISYLTLIPADTIAAIFVSVEKPVDTGVNGVGISGSVDIPDPAAAPEIDVASLSC